MTEFIIDLTLFSTNEINGELIFFRFDPVRVVILTMAVFCIPFTVYCLLSTVFTVKFPTFCFFRRPRKSMKILKPMRLKVFGQKRIKVLKKKRIPNQFFFITLGTGI